MTKRILYDLAGADPDRRFSPYCWRAKLALAHKGLTVETVPWRFTDKEAIAVSGQDKVPVLIDGERVVSDSWTIALYLEQAYPDAPSLFGGPQAMALARFVSHWTDRALTANVFRVVVADIEAHLDPKDKAYFRASREARVGKTLEEARAERDAFVGPFREGLAPLRALLREQPFLAGEASNYADYIPFSILQWAGNISSFALLAEDDPIAEWRERVADLHGGLARAGRKVPLV